MTALFIIGCGYVADLYMRSLKCYPELRVSGAFDRDPGRQAAFGDYWNVPMAGSIAEMLSGQDERGLVLNLTNPASHVAVTTQCLEAGFHVYSEKPLALEMEQALALHTLAAKNDLILASAPCSVLAETAQILSRAVRDNVVGTPRLIYAELDDGFIPQAPYKDWVSESGAPWPFEDEFRTGCTLEHAGYYLTWLIAMFGSVEKVVAASAELLPSKGFSGTPDFSVATLFFQNGPVARLTCSIVAPHNHKIEVIGEKGVLRVKKAWDNAAPVRFHRRFTMRRRLMEHPIGTRVKPRGVTHPKVKRRGAAAMNFALGPVEVLTAIAENRAPRLNSDFALHLNEVTLAIQNPREDTRHMSTRCKAMEPMPWAK